MATVVKSFKRKREVIPNLRTWKPGDPLKEFDQYITVVKSKNNHYYLISSVFTADHGYETMVFECDSNGKNVGFMFDYYCEQYENEEDMVRGHKNVVDHFEELVGRGI